MNSTPISIPSLETLTETMRRGERVEGGAVVAALEKARKRLLAARSEADDLRARVHELQDLLRTDPVTGLGNRRAFEERLDDALAAAGRHGECGAVVFIDCDNFKAVNDRFGHIAGDEVLRRIARILTARVRQTDFVGRFGGDEFVILQEQCPLHVATERMQALEQELRETRVELQSGFVTLHASFGVTAFDPSTSPRRLLRAADAAMYERKRESRELLIRAPETAELSSRDAATGVQGPAPREFV